MEETRLRNDTLQWRGQMIGLDRALELLNNFAATDPRGTSDDAKKALRGAYGEIEAERNRIAERHSASAKKLDETVERNRIRPE